VPIKIVIEVSSILKKKIEFENWPPKVRTLAKTLKQEIMVKYVAISEFAAYIAGALQLKLGSKQKHSKIKCSHKTNAPKGNLTQSKCSQNTVQENFPIFQHETLFL
jgi:hypothetical protein